MSDRPPPSTSAPLADFRADRRIILLSLLALPIGALGAVVARALLWLIAVFTNLAFFHRFSAGPATPQESPLGAWIIIVPVVGALVIGLMARYGSDKIRGHGIPEALEAILLGRSLINPKVAVLKPVSSAISIGTGGPFGAEGPIIMTGGAFGSLFAQLFHLTSSERKTLLVAGAAAGMTAVFATPIAAVLLAVELLLFEWRPRSFVPVAVAATVASLMRVPLLGEGPIFPVMPHTALPASAIGVAAAVGLAAGFASFLLTFLVYACEDRFEKLPIHSMWWPALGALAVGIGGWLDPRVLGVGYQFIHGLLRGELVGTAALTLLLAKGLVWAIALGSGTSGGVLAPLLMIGGALGVAAGAPFGIGDASLWAMVGMAAMMGGTMRSPLTGMVFLLELTQDLHSLPALLAGTIAALCVTVLLLPRSILTEKLARRGQHIARDYSVDVFDLRRVADVMDSNPPLVGADAPLAQVLERISDHRDALARRQAIFVCDGGGELAGIVTRGDLLRAKSAALDRPILEFATTDVAVLPPRRNAARRLGENVAARRGPPARRRARGAPPNPRLSGARRYSGGAR